MKVQYMVQKLDTKDVVAAAKKLNELAAEGWRIQSTNIMNVTLVVVLWKDANNKEG